MENNDTWQTWSAQFSNEESEQLEKYQKKNNFTSKSETVRFAMMLVTGIYPTFEKVFDTPKQKEFGDFLEKKVEAFFQELIKEEDFMTIAKECFEEIQATGKKIDWTDFLAGLKPFLEHNAVGRPKIEKEEPKRY